MFYSGCHAHNPEVHALQTAHTQYTESLNSGHLTLQQLCNKSYS